MVAIESKTCFPAALRRAFAALAAVAALTLYNINNCAFAQDWSPENYKGNLTVEALFDWDVPVSVVQTGAYDAAWMAAPSNVAVAISNDLSVTLSSLGVPTSNFVVEDGWAEWWDDMDTCTPQDYMIWYNAIQESPDLGVTNTPPSGLSPWLSVTSVTTYADTVLGQDPALPAGDPTAGSLSFGLSGIVLTELTGDDIEASFGIASAFEGLQDSQYFAWVPRYWSTVRDSICAFVNRPRVTSFLRRIYQIGAVACFWVLATRNVISALFAPLAGVLRGFSGGGAA